MEVRALQQAVAQMPHCTRTIIGGAGHDIHLDQPQVFMRQLKQFLTVTHKKR
jgi:pimeloyl-ACP methyl ester carboxylesterase